MVKEDFLADIEEKLNKISIFDLRQIAREVGVKRPADGKKAHIIESILEIAQGKVEPIAQSKRGAPPKSQVYDKEMVALILKCRSVYLQLTDAESLTSSKMQVSDSAYDGDEKQVTGILDKSGEEWFLRVNGSYLSPSEDVFVHEYYVNSNNLRHGDVVLCKARASVNGLYGLTEVISVNGAEAEEERVKFENLTRIYPQKRIITATDASDITGRMIDLFSPVALGQRAFIISPAKCGKTFIIKNIMQGISKNNADLHLIVLLTACRPEEAEDFKRSLPEGAEFYYTTFNLEKSEHARVARLAFERAKRSTESGYNTLILADGLYRASVFDNPSEADKLMYCACNTEEGASLTAIASKECGSNGGDGAATDIANMCVTLSRGLAITRTFPAIDILNTYSDGEEKFLSDKEVGAVTNLRRQVFNGTPAYQIVDLFKQTKSNSEITEKFKN